MASIAEIGRDLREACGLTYHPIGFGYRQLRPQHALSLKQKGSGCIMPLIFAAARGRTVAIDQGSTGWACSAFYLGFSDWVFPGIESYLSDGLEGRECERFVRSPELAKRYLESVRYERASTGVAVFEPLERISDEDAPEVVIFFADADRMSALVFLATFSDPMQPDRIVTRFASACGAVTALPLQFARARKTCAVWGMHDISARARLPRELMTLAMPLDLARQMHADIDKSFLRTSQWAKIVERSEPEPSKAPV